MRNALSTDLSSGTTRFQDEAPAQSFLDLLDATDYEVKIVSVKKSLAQVSFIMAEQLKRASDAALTIEMSRRGFSVARKILNGKHYDSGKKKHQRKSQKRGNQKCE